jgi:predicted CoA-binding protein
MNKKTVILSSRPESNPYAQRAAMMLQQAQIEFVPVGLKIETGEVCGQKVLDLRTKPGIEGVDTVTLYVHPGAQQAWYDYILQLHPKRIIFNPGTENQDFKLLAEKQGIACLEACTLVMLSIGNF